MPKELATLLEEYYRRRALGEELDPRAFKERAGPLYEEFLRNVESGAARDARRAPTREQKFPFPFGEYLLLREIGRGANGVVYEAVHRELGRKVALKILRLIRVGDERAMERFRREAQLCSRVRHDHIVEIYEAGDVDGRPFFVMEYVEGRTLEELVRADETPPPAELAESMALIADAVQHLHDGGIVHRDLKPANIMFHTDGRPVLADFGLARADTNEELTRTGDALGTPVFMSPEQLLGQRDKIDARTDVYGLGATLYYGLTGGTLVPRGDPHEMVRAILEKPPRPAHARNHAVPRPLSAVVSRAVAKNHRDRQQSAGELRDQLRYAARQRRGSRGPVLLTIAALLVVAVGLIFWMRRPARLTVNAFPVAQVRVDGELLGQSNETYRIPPGSHTLQIEMAGFRTDERSVHLKPGGSLDIDIVLVIENIRDPEQVAKLAALIDLELPPAPRPKPTANVQRTTTEIDQVTAAVLPRGDVALEDLDGVWLRVSAYDDGRLVFRTADETLYAVPYAPEKDWSFVRLPPAVRTALARLEPGTEVTWGFVTNERREHLATFRLVDPTPVDERFESVEPRLGDNPAPLHTLFRAQVLLDARRDYGAWRAARHAKGAAPGSALAIEQAALDRMNVDEPMLRRDLDRRIAALSK